MTSDENYGFLEEKLLNSSDRTECGEKCISRKHMNCNE